MIKLDKNKYIEIEDWYLNTMYPKIINNIENDDFLSDLREWLCDKGLDHNSIDQENFWKCLLINPFSRESRDCYKLLDEYYNLCMLLQRDERYIKLKYNFGKINGCNENSKKIYSSHREDILNEYFINTPIKTVIDSDLGITTYYNSFINYNKLFRQIKKYMKEFNDKIYKIINYDILSKFNDTRAELILKLDFNVCPYCNRQYINKYKKDGKECSTLAHLDHFIPKKYFLLYSLSLYNFIPSCAACNTMLKNTANLPINELISDISNKENLFKFSYHDPSSLLGLNENLTIEIDKTNLNSYLLNEQFALESQYEYHKNEVKYFRKRLLLASSNVYKDGLKLFLNITNDDEISKIITGYSPTTSDIYNQPLAKFHYDLYHSTPVVKKHDLVTTKKEVTNL